MLSRRGGGGEGACAACPRSAARSSSRMSDRSSSAVIVMMRTGALTACPPTRRRGGGAPVSSRSEAPWPHLPLTADAPLLDRDAVGARLLDLADHALGDPQVHVDDEGVGAADPREARLDPPRALLLDLLTQDARPDRVRSDGGLSSCVRVGEAGVEVSGM